MNRYFKDGFEKAAKIDLLLRENNPKGETFFHRNAPGVLPIAGLGALSGALMPLDGSAKKRALIGALVAGGLSAAAQHFGKQ